MQNDPAYKDASALRQECLTKGQFTLAVLPFTAADKRSEMAGKAQAYAMTALSATKDPFLRLVDRENMDRILAEQRLSMSGVVDEQTAGVPCGFWVRYTVPRKCPTVTPSWLVTVTRANPTFREVVSCSPTALSTSPGFTAAG